MNCSNIKQNEGTTDRTIRVIIGVSALLAGNLWLSGMAQTVAYVVGVAALLTGMIGFCGLYAILGISTKK